MWLYLLRAVADVRWKNILMGVDGVFTQIFLFELN